MSRSTASKGTSQADNAQIRPEFIPVEIPTNTAGFRLQHPER